MSNYPLYPTLSEEGNEQAEKIIEKFKADLSKVAEEAITTLYADIPLYIETDSWSNFRNQIMSGFKDYNNRHIQNKYDFAEIRQSILKNHREDIIADLNQDLLLEIESLKKQLADLREFHRER